MIRRHVLLALAAHFLLLVGPAPAGASVEADRHFVVFAAQNGVFYDQSGPAFVMVLRIAGDTMDVGALGIHEENRIPVFGPVPEKTYSRFLDRSADRFDAMLRMEITAGQYEKVLNVLRTWDRRVREGALLYPDLFMNNMLFVKQAAEALDCCGGTIALYALDWGLEDTISENNIPSRVPFLYFKELRRLNGSRHVRDADMPKVARATGPPAATGRR